MVVTFTFEANVAVAYITRPFKKESVARGNLILEHFRA
jgi:hypothetical protein